MLVKFVKDNFLSICRYVLVGAGVYGVEYILYLLAVLSFSVAPLYANAVVKIIAGLFGYFFHRIYTFKKDFKDGFVKDLSKYVAVLIVNIPLFSLIFSAIAWLELDFKITKIIADIFCILIAYLQTKFLVFGVVENKK